MLPDNYMLTSIVTGDLETVVTGIEKLLALQRSTYIADIENAKVAVPMELQKPLFRDIIAHVTPFALHRILDQYKKINEEPKNCTNSFTTVSGLPCVYRIKARISEGAGTIQIEDISSHWRFKKPAAYCTRKTLSEIEELQQPIDPLLSVHEPAVVRTKGRPKGPQELPTRAEFEKSTQREPSQFEQVERYLTQRSKTLRVRGTRRGRGQGRGYRRGGTTALNHCTTIESDHSEAGDSESNCVSDSESERYPLRSRIPLRQKVSGRATENSDNNEAPRVLKNSGNNIKATALSELAIEDLGDDTEALALAALVIEDSGNDTEALALAIEDSGNTKAAPEDSDNNDNDSITSDMMAKLALSEDPQLEERLYRVRSGVDDYGGLLKKSLDNHLLNKQLNPDMVQQKSLKWRRFWAEKAYHKLTRKEYYYATDRDDIPPPPSFDTSIDGPFISKQDQFRSTAESLHSWAVCDSEKEHELNPLRHSPERVLGYWSKYDPQQKMPTNPMRHVAERQLRPRKQVSIRDGRGQS